jgi:hypothetical protein
LKYLRVFSVSKPNEIHCLEIGHILSRDVRILSDKGLLKNGQILSCFSLINGAIRTFSSSSLEDAGSSSLEDAGSSSLEDAGSSSAVSVMGAGNSLTGDNSLFDNSLNGDDSGDRLKGDDSLFDNSLNGDDSGDRLKGDDSLFGDRLIGDDSLFGDNSLTGDDSLFGITPPIPRETVRDPLLDAFEFFLV